jgi:hypothetical protein
MNDLHTTILEVYFFAFIDEGAAPNQTPLFTGSHAGQPLAGIIARDFGLSPEEAESALEIARKEVEL